MFFESTVQLFTHCRRLICLMDRAPGLCHRSMAAELARFAVVAFLSLALVERAPAQAVAPSKDSTTITGNGAVNLRVGSFTVDVTIPLGHRCMGLLPTKSQTIADSLEAKGIVLLGSDRPIVLVAVDWCEIRNGAYDAWREAIADAVGTKRERVLVAALHQHDAPVVDMDAGRLLREVGLADELYDETFHRDVLQRVAAAAKESLSKTRPVTSIGTGKAEVDRIASSRRMVEENGRVHFGRGSSSGKDPKSAAAPEGEVDRWLRTVALMDGDEVIVELHSYATHPMSYYGRGEVTSDFVGLARKQRQSELPSSQQIYFSGCSGDVTAGKYNDGSAESRAALTERLADAMRRSHAALTRLPVTKCQLRSTPLELEYSPNSHLAEESLKRNLQAKDISVIERIYAAMSLSSRMRVAEKRPIDFVCLDLGAVKIVLYPGESFVGHQLKAQAAHPDMFLFPIGYGECWPGYVPTEDAFSEGFEDKWLWVAPGSEARIKEALNRVLP